jgi:sugar O-acyltransferase (sialic acid O-acetyltransferase NeuD family)
MHTERIFLIGAGGHAKVVLDALLTTGMDPAVVAVRDDDPALAGSLLLSVPVATPALFAGIAGSRFHVAIGANGGRAGLVARLKAMEGRPYTVVHPAAGVSTHALVRDAVFVAAKSVIGPKATVEEGCIVNHGAVVDHDCILGAYCHVAPNATLGGNVRLGCRVLIGAGANVLPGVSIGDDVTVGAGAVVTRDVPAGKICLGVPAAW